MYTQAQCKPFVGRWIGFRTRYGQHMGYVERVTGQHMIIVAPREQVPTQHATLLRVTDEEKLDMALTFGWGGRPGFGGGYGGGGGAAAPYGGGSGAAMPYGGGYPGRGYGRGGYGGWGNGWYRWAVAFLIIYVLWGLWFW